MAEKKTENEPQSAAASSAQTSGQASIKVRRYRVRSGGISTASGTVWKDEIVDAARLGDDARVQALLSKQAIEVVSD